jgi:hypothetical protein
MDAKSVCRKQKLSLRDLGKVNNVIINKNTFVDSFHTHMYSAKVIQFFVYSVGMYVRYILN